MSEGIVSDGGACWYFAYGANMATRLLAKRSIAATASEPAVLRDHRLVFTALGYPWMAEPAWAGVERSPGEEVHGVLHRITGAELLLLDRLEGALYRRIERDVEGTRSGRVAASTYEVVAPVQQLKPSRRYLRLLIAGAQEHGLPEEYRRRLSSIPVTYVPGYSELMQGVSHTIDKVFIAMSRRKSDETTKENQE